MFLIGNQSINNNYNNCLLLVFLLLVFLLVCSYSLSSEYCHIFVIGLLGPQLFLSDWFSIFLPDLPFLNTLSLCLSHSSICDILQFSVWHFDLCTALQDEPFGLINQLTLWSLHRIQAFSIPPPLCSPLCPHVQVYLSIDCGSSESTGDYVLITASFTGPVVYLHCLQIPPPSSMTLKNECP